MLNTVRSTYNEFPLKFWILVLSSFIDGVGGTMIGPFFALYITQRFDVGMTEAGLLFAIFSVTGLLGSMVGGALTDKIGRRWMVLFGLVFSAVSSLSMGFAAQLITFYLLAVVVGSLSNVGGPARQAMVADMLPKEKHADGYGTLRVAGNLAWIIGPTLGGVLAERSYLLLFIGDAVASLITAVIVYRLVPETKPELSDAEDKQSLLETFIGYRLVIRDRVYLAYLLTSMLMLIVYQQMYYTLSVYLRDMHGVSTTQFGYLLSLDAGVVVLFQFAVTRRIRNRPPMLMMILGTAFYLIGFTMYGFVATYFLFIVAILLITVGEMIVVPVGQALVARFAPPAMRGRYMAIYTLAWTIPASVGPWAAGLIMDNYNPDWVWYAGGIICAVAIAGFTLLHSRVKERFASSAAVM